MQANSLTYIILSVEHSRRAYYASSTTPRLGIESSVDPAVLKISLVSLLE